MGLLRAIILTAVLLPGLILFLYQKLTDSHYGYASVGVALLFVWMIHRGRKDYRFLSKTSATPAWTIFAEYLVFSVPFLALLVVSRQYLPAPAYVVLLFPLCFVTPSSKSARERTYRRFIKYIPAEIFEWKSGFRGSLPVIIMLYIVGLAGIYQIWFAAVSVGLLVMTLITFYAENESRQILCASERSAGNFLRSKLLRHVRCWVLFLLPLFIAAAVHYEYIWYILAAFAAVINLAVFAVLLKYAFYRPAMSAGITQLIGAVAGLCTVILPFSVLVLAANIILFFKAERNLTYYLDAYR